MHAPRKAYKQRHTRIVLTRIVYPTDHRVLPCAKDRGLVPLLRVQVM